MKKLSTYRIRGMLVCGAVLVVSLVWMTQAVLALPPRPDSRAPVKGASIELHVEGLGPDMWAVVQWLDGLGEWHDVDGWRGELEEQRVTWWVSPKHFGDGPFRWVVYRGADGKILASSESFDLPAGHGQLVRVAVLIGE
jgi:hypothetical protein